MPSQGTGFHPRVIEWSCWKNSLIFAAVKYNKYKIGKLGMRVKDVQRVLSLNQWAWLKSIIKFNTHRQRLIKQQWIQTRFFKFVNNAQLIRKICIFKDKTRSLPILDFVGLRVKFYSLVTLNNIKNVTKGVSRSANENQIKHEKYKLCVHTKCQIYATAHSYHLHIYATNITKQAFSPYKDKCYVLDDGETTLKCEYYNILCYTTLKKICNIVRRLGI